MTNVHTPADPRRSKAITIQAANQWKFFQDAEGRRSWSIPSSKKPRLHYRVTEDGCTCDDLRYRPWVACKHMLAVRAELAQEEEWAF